MNGDIILKSSDITVSTDSLAINASHDLVIENTKLNATSSSSTAVYAGSSASISGTSDVKGNGYYRALQAMDISISGGTVDASSSNDMAIWGLNGIDITGGKIHAKGADNYAAIGVRVNQQPDEGDPSPKIKMNENYEEISGGKISVSSWSTSGSAQRSWTSFIAKDDENALASDKSNALNEVTIQIKGANYDAVNAAIKVANALNKENYVDFSAVTAAIQAVVAGKDITEQAIVDGYATALETALNGLVKKTVSPQSPDTGNNSNRFFWIALLFVSGDALLTLCVKCRKHMIEQKRL